MKTEKPARRSTKWLPLLALLLTALLAARGGARAQEPLDEAHFRRAIDRDPGRALDELNASVRAAPDGATRARLRLLRAIALARLGEREDALDDLRFVLGEPREERVETEAAKLVRSLRGLDVALEAPLVSAPGEAAVSLVGSAQAKLPVEWALYRVDSEKLRAELLASPERGLEAHLRRPSPDALARVDAWNETIEANGRFERRLPLPRAAAPGIYLVAASVALAPARATVVVSRHVPLVKLASRGGLVFVAGQDGSPRGGAALDVLEGPAVRTLGTADERGVLRFDSLGEGELLAWSEGTLARLPLNGLAARAPAPGAPPLTLLVDRPLVRPGEDVRALAFSPVPSSRHRVVLEDARGEPLIASYLALDTSGLGEVSFPIPLAALEGRARLAARGGSAAFRVLAPRTRAFAFEITDSLAFVAPGTPFVAHVRAALVEGVPLAGGQAEWTIRPRGGGAEIARGTALLDADAEARIEAPLPPASTGRELVFEARLRDPAGRLESDAVPFRTLASLLRIEPALVPEVVAPRDRVSLSLSVKNQDGSAARGVAVLLSATLVRDGVSRKLIEREERTRADGGIDLPLPLDETGRFTIDMEARDARGSVARATRTIHVLDESYAGEPEPAIRVRTARPRSRPGESARVFVRFPAPSGDALVTRERDAIRLARVLPFRSGVLVVEVPLDETDVPGAELSVSSVIAGRLLETRIHLPVSRSESFLLESQLEKAVLGADEPFSLTARTLSARERAPLPAALRLSTADARLEELLGETSRAHATAPRSHGVFAGSLPIAPVHDESVEEAPGEDDPALVNAARSLARPAPPGLFAVKASADATGSAALETLPFAPPCGRARMRVALAAVAGGSLSLSEEEVRVQPELEVGVSLPERIVVGDEGRVSARIAASRVTGEGEDVKVSWTARGLALDGTPRIEGAKLAEGHEAEPGSAWIAARAGATARLTWNARAPAQGAASLEVFAEGARSRARGRADAIVLGHGAPREKTIAGSLAGAPVVIEPTADDATAPDAVRAEIVLAPSTAAAARDALEALAARGEPSGRGKERVEAEAARLALVALAPLSSACGAALELAPGTGERAALALVELQRGDGAWPGSSTAAALEGLSIAALHSGTWLVSSSLERGAAAASRELSRAPPEDRPALALALALVGRAPIVELASIYEKRALLSPIARGALGRALLLSGRRDDALACARELE
ncbi:hypothetical protein HY251_15940, partial [bacterium]|nr:hypothetical protein [bacterium]